MNSVVSVSTLSGFSSISALFYKNGLKSKINRMHKFAHTNKYMKLLDVQ